MYRAIIPCLPQNIRPAEQDSTGRDIQKIFTPFLAAYEIHSITLITAPLVQTEEDFNINSPFIVWKCNPQLESDDKVLLNIDYFYKNSIFKPEITSLSQAVIKSTLDPNTTSQNQSIIEKRIELFAKHLIDGLFSFDNGLYKEAVVNFGTVIEIILNIGLKHNTLNQLIQSPPAHLPITGIMTELNNIRISRNKVHAGTLKSISDITRGEAALRRHDLDKIIACITDLSYLP